MSNATQLILSIPSIVASTIIFARIYQKLPWISILESRSPNSPLTVNLGLGYSLLLAYNYLLIGAIFLIFVKVKSISPRMYTRRITVFTFLLVVPWVAHFVYISGVSPYNLDISPMLSNVAAILVLWIRPDRLYREDVLPLARESIIDNMLDSVFLVDAMDSILYMNPAAIELAGVESEIEGMTISEIWPDLIEQLNLHSGLVGQEVEFENEDVKHTYEASVSTMRNASMNVTNRIVVLRDITEHRKYSENLERLVSERTKQLRNAERLATIGETATMVGHDLRNPLQVIVGYTQFLSSMLSKEKLPN